MFPTLRFLLRLPTGDRAWMPWPPGCRDGHPNAYETLIRIEECFRC